MTDGKLTIDVSDLSQVAEVTWPDIRKYRLSVRSPGVTGWRAGQLRGRARGGDGVAGADAGERRAPLALTEADLDGGRAARHPGRADALCLAAVLVIHASGAWHERARHHARALLDAATALPRRNTSVKCRS
ncbi:hypothetical protein ACH4Y0_38060 [Streptomyces sp. NPDC020707]|uniref:hypothetical protein n=1 Tax=Streptomyces sp. NPDC020707 TaxID=3365084 RepID=UPI00379A683E